MSQISDLKRHVSDAATRPDVREAVGRLYAELAAEVNARRPVCSMSGRCCRFEEYRHRLYVTTLELAAFVGGLNDSTRPDAWPWDGTGCPFQVGKLCGVHPIRPMGCRMFFCDPTSTEWQNDLYERLHGRLKRLHDELGVPYNYVEWRQALAAMDLAERPPGGP